MFHYIEFLNKLFKPIFFIQMMVLLVGVLMWGVLLGVIFTFIYEYVIIFVKMMAGKELNVFVKGYMVHHSIYGPALFILAFFYSSILLVGIGLGNLLRHTWEEGRFVIFEKV